MTELDSHTRVELARLATAWRAGIEEEIPAAVALRHELHATADLSGAEEPTTQRVLAALPLPFSASETVADTGRLLRLGPPGAAIGLRAELDALPMLERTGAPFASSSGVMHACGHDVHLAGLVAVLRAAARLELPFGLLAVLQPREEVGPSGAEDIVVSGRLLEHDVRALVAAHVQPQMPARHVSADPGPVNAAIDEVEIVIHGHGGHGAYPHLARDPVPVLCRAVLALQEAARSVVNPLHPVVISMTQLVGSTAPNVIPDVARSFGTVRAMHEGDREPLHAANREMVAGIAAAHGCVGEYTVVRGEPSLFNDPRLAEGTQHWLSEFGIPRSSFASCGSDDFANYGVQVPILMQFVGTGEGTVGPMLHDSRYLPPDHTVRDVALALLAGYLGATEYLHTP
jgi:amidohydrolase